MEEYKVLIRPDYYDEEIIIHTNETIKFDYENDIVMLGNTRLEVPNLLKVFQAKKSYVELEGEK